MKIIDIRNTQSHGLIADVYLNPLSILPVSIPFDDCDLDALIEYANTDTLHICYGKVKCHQVIVSKSFAERWSNNPKDYHNHYRTNKVILN